MIQPLLNQLDEGSILIDEWKSEEVLFDYFCKMTIMSQLKSKLMTVFFWILIVTILVLQLLAAGEYSFVNAILYSITITGTFAIYVHLISKQIIKNHLQKKQFGQLIFWILLACVLTSVVLAFEDYSISSFFDKDWEKHKISILPQFFGMLMATILISGIAYAFELYEQHIATLKAAQILKDSLNDLEVKSIRQQLSPHFTFNILNNLQFLIQKDKDEALQLLAQYSKILRYYVYESQQKAIFLNNEVAFLKTYLDLEKSRLEADAQVNVDIAIEPNTIKIAPFILSAFVENCFKHLSVADKWIDIVIHYKEKELFMSIQNSYDANQSANNNQQGVGLEHTKKRLELIYPQKYSLEMSKDEKTFLITLNIKFD